jgi:hypothetical protein
MDNLLLNLILCLVTIGILVIGFIYNSYAAYGLAGSIYFLQFLEYCCSNTKAMINNIENID